jgi:hypothetical protein
MDYNTATMTRLAEQVVKAFQQMTPVDQPGETIADVETNLRAFLQQLGAQALSRLLSTNTGTPPAEIPCPCGGTLHYQRQRAATLISVFGKITYERAYYAGCACGAGKAPLDVQYALQPGAVTSGLAALLALAGIGFGFEDSRTWLRAFLLFDVSENTVRAETQTFGTLQTARETALCAQSQSPDALQTRLREITTVPKRLYGSMDAAKVRIEPRTQAGQKPEKTEAWRDLKIGCWYEAEAVPPSQRTHRQRAKATREQTVFRAKQMRYYCDIAEAEDFGALLWGTGCALAADFAQELVFVCDGAVWIWKLVTQYYPNALQIVDWFHAADRLQRVAQSAFPHLPERKEWLDAVTADLWAGQVPAVIQACERLASHCAEAQQAVCYFTNNMARMQYAQFRAAGYMIGSGTIESACKQIVTQRLKLPGAQWEVEGAVLTAKARAAYLSGEWEVLATQRAALPLAA